MSEPRLLMATVYDYKNGEESEPVTVQRDGDVVFLTLVDGTDVALSVAELQEALAA